MGELTLPGGRYACAQTLKSRNLQCFEGRSLGQLCHIVQLAISEKKLLGYLNGTVVTYDRSQSMIKETLAVQHQALTKPCNEAASLPCATWEEATTHLRTMLEEARAPDQEEPAQVALSNVKRTFRSQFHLELSETMLGHSKLSELLQDYRFAEICDVKLDRHGYSVVQRQPSTATRVGTGGFCPGEALCLADAEDLNETPMFGPTPGPFGATPVTLRGASFGDAEPLCIEDADKPMDVPSFGPTPGPFGSTPVPSQPSVDMPVMQEGQSYLNKFLQDYFVDRAQSVSQGTENLPPFCPHEPLCLDELDEAIGFTDVPAFGPSPGPAWSPAPRAVPAMPVASSALPSFAPWRDGQLSQMVQRTFIHAPQLAGSPLPGALPRSSSTGDLSGSTSARSNSSRSSSANLVFDTSPHDVELSKPVVSGMPHLSGTTGLSSVPTYVVSVPPFAYTMPLLDNLAPCPPCPPPALPPVLRLFDHLSS